MGAVFALFGAFYYWIGKITGYAYPEELGQAQFWTMFIGVNVTFLPQHFLGLAGFPRRYSDFADAYAGFNYISSLGSIISLVSVFIFMGVIYRIFTDGEVVCSNYWHSPQLFELSHDTVTVPSLEWTQTSPPTFHTYEELPYLIADDNSVT
jgi:cytochrome c oxidase subunit 1